MPTSNRKISDDEFILLYAVSATILICDLVALALLFCLCFALLWQISASGTNVNTHDLTDFGGYAIMGAIYVVIGVSCLVYYRNVSKSRLRCFILFAMTAVISSYPVYFLLQTAPNSNLPVGLPIVVLLNSTMGLFFINYLTNHFRGKAFISAALTASWKHK